MGTWGVESTEKGLNCLEVLEEGNLDIYVLYISRFLNHCNYMILYFKMECLLNLFLKLTGFTDFGSSYIFLKKIIHRIVFVRIYFICLIRWPLIFSCGLGVDQ